MNLVKLIKTVLSGGQKTEKTSDLPLDTRIDLGGGNSASLGEMIEFERANHCHAVQADDYIEQDGVRYHCGTLVSHFKEKMSAGHHAGGDTRVNSIERVVATDTPEQKAARDAVFASADALKPLKEALDSADAEVIRINSLATATDAEKATAKTNAETAKATHDAALLKGGETVERFNSLLAAKKETKVSTEESPELKQARADLAVANKKIADAEKATVERDNAARIAGMESFAILAGAAERGTSKTVFLPPKSGREAKLALGRKLAGSDRSAGKN